MACQKTKAADAATPVATAARPTVRSEPCPAQRWVDRPFCEDARYDN